MTDTDTFDLQEMKKGEKVFFYSLIIAADIDIYLSYVIINDNLLK